jgi:hypothetical protein
MIFPQDVTWPNNFFCCFPYFFLKINKSQLYFCASSNIDPPYFGHSCYLQWIALLWISECHVNHALPHWKKGLTRRLDSKDILLRNPEATVVCAVTRCGDTFRTPVEWPPGVKIPWYFIFYFQGIREKLLSAQRHDTPRWGDYPEKTELPYIEELIRRGEWFDGSKPFIPIFR